MQPTERFAQPVAWVTGASSGIGRALCLKLAAEGYRVAASARGTEALQALEIEGKGGIKSFPLDVTDRDRVREMPERVAVELGPVSLAVFCAGSYKRDRPSAFDSGKLRAMMELNVMGTAHCLEAVIADMIAREGGQIGVVSSVAGYNGLPGAAFYGATKAALINMCEAMQPELKTKGIDLRIINPGFVATPLTAKNDFPMPFMITADEAAESIVAGLKSRRYEIIFPWKMALAISLLHALPQGLRFALTRRMLRKG